MTPEPEALRVAKKLEIDELAFLNYEITDSAARLLREQHAEIERLRAENELLRDALRPIKL